MAVQAARRPVIAAGRGVQQHRCVIGQSSTGVHPAKTRNISSSARRSSVVSDTVDSMVAKLASTKGQEAPKEDGLRLLVFGKPGSGKVSPVASDERITADSLVGHSKLKVRSASLLRYPCTD